MKQAMVVFVFQLLILATISNEVIAASFFDNLKEAMQDVSSFLNDIGNGAIKVMDAWHFIQDFVDSSIDEDCDFKCSLGKYLQVTALP